MRANIGIRRRLAPLLDNDRNQIELFTALLLSLPGSPVLYYGDEIGMGDNIWLGDRDGVRTPMQWTPDRNAGLLLLRPGPAVYPPVQDAVYGYQVTNVEARPEELDLAPALDPADDRGAQAEPGLRARLVHGPRGQQPLGVRVRPRVGRTGRHRHGAVREQPVPVRPAGRARPAGFEGVQPVELLGGAHFPPIGELPYLLTLAGHGFYWFRLDRGRAGGP